MIINGANTYINPDSGIGLTKSREDNNSPAARLLGKTRNDKLDLSELFKKYSEDIKDPKKKAEIKQMLLEISEEDKLSKYDKVQKAYSEMKRILNNQIKQAQGEIEWFNRLSKEKQYYQNILDSADGDSITITNGKYLLSDLDDGTVVSRKDIEDCIAYIERKIQNDLIAKKDAMFIGDHVGPSTKEEVLEWLERRRSEVIIPDQYPSDDMIYDEKINSAMTWDRNAFNQCAEDFLEATGIDLRVSSDSPMFSKEGYTENNFLEKTQERLDLLKNSLSSLEKAMHDYLKLERAIESYVLQKDISAKLTIYFRKQESVSEMLDDFDEVIEQNSEKISEME